MFHGENYISSRRLLSIDTAKIPRIKVLLALQLNVLCKVGFAGLTPRKQGKLLSRFLFQWIHRNGQQSLFLFPVPSPCTR